MKLRIIIIIFFLVLIFESCHVQKTNVAVVHPVKNVEIDRTVKNQSVSLIKPKLYFAPNDTMISFIDASSAMLRFWSLKTTPMLIPLTSDFSISSLFRIISLYRKTQ